MIDPIHPYTLRDFSSVMESMPTTRIFSHILRCNFSFEYSVTTLNLWDFDYAPLVSTGIHLKIIFEKIFFKQHAEISYRRSFALLFPVIGNTAILHLDTMKDGPSRDNHLLSYGLNLIDIFYKCAIIPFLDKEKITENHYYTYVKDKSLLTCFILLIPIIGQKICRVVKAWNIRKRQEALRELPLTARDEIVNASVDALSILNLKKYTLAALPPLVCEIKSLEQLMLCDNLLTNLPKEFGQLTNLTKFCLHENRLSSLPAEIGHLTKLKSLDLGDNLVDSLPTEIGLLTALESLFLEKNRLTSLPAECEKLTKLTVLDLGGNHLRTLPSALWKLTHLKELYLDGTQLTLLPTEIGLLTHLEELVLTNNQLTCLPTEIGRLTQLKKLSIEYNRLTSLPDEIGLLTQLECISLAGNRPLREIPMRLGAITSLTSMTLSRTSVPITILSAILGESRRERDKDAMRGLPARIEKWKAFAGSSTPFDCSLTEKQKCTLNEWLTRLERTKDFTHSQERLAKIVCAILDDLHNPKFSPLFFSQAEANNECCEDRAAMSLNEIYTCWLLVCKIDKEKLPELLGVAKTVYLRKRLQQLIERFEKEMKTVERESVEIFLFYETILRDELGLKSAIQSMTYAGIGERSWISQEELIKEVNVNFYEELIRLPLFEEMMQEKWQIINEQFLEDLEKLGERPAGSDLSPAVLDYESERAKLSTQWKEKKIAAAKEFIK